MDGMKRRTFLGGLVGAAALSGVKAEASPMNEIVGRSFEYADELEDIFTDFATSDGQEREEQKKILEDKFTNITERFLNDFARMSGQKRNAENDAAALKDGLFRISNSPIENGLKVQIKSRLEIEISKRSRKR